MRATVRIVSLAMMLALVGCSSGQGEGGEPPAPAGDEAVATTEVDLPKSYRFEPEVISVSAGATVTWTNSDDFPHNVHLLDGSDTTVDLPIGASGELEFAEAGEFAYECSIHPQQMRGRVIVA